MIFDQAEFDLRCEWGAPGVAQLAPISDAVVVVDVLSFSTSVAIAVARGAVVYPYRWRDDASAFARTVGAQVAGNRWEEGLSLSPASLTALPAGTKLVLPSPNGATLSLGTGGVPTFAGCLRNAAAVAAAARRCGPRIAVIPAGERWREDEALRPAIEDWLGAGAILRHLDGSRSPEAQLAVAAFEGVADRLHETLAACSSGKELLARGFADDVRLSAELDADAVAPFLRDGAFSP